MLAFIDRLLTCNADVAYLTLMVCFRVFLKKNMESARKAASNGTVEHILL
jgi:hypothetical protein